MISIRKDPQKMARIRQMLSDGRTLEEIGSAIGCSRERVRQIITPLGLKKVGPQARLEKKLGCTVAEYKALTRGRPRVRVAYKKERAYAIDQGIAWEFTFATWWALWQQSGMWGQRGVGNDQFCLSRRDPNGPYSASNAVIMTRLAHHAPKLLKTRQGWSIETRVKARPYFVRFNGEVIGRFPTEKEAALCYQRALHDVRATAVSVGPDKS